MLIGTQLFSAPRELDRGLIRSLTDHAENEFALRGQIRNDIAALPNASIYVP